jgi:hypothetical protein
MRLNFFFRTKVRFQHKSYKATKENKSFCFLLLLCNFCAEKRKLEYQTKSMMQERPFLAYRLVKNSKLRLTLRTFSKTTIRKLFFNDE